MSTFAAGPHSLQLGTDDTNIARWSLRTQEEGVAIGIMVLGVLLFGYVIGAVTDLIRARHTACNDGRD